MGYAFLITLFLLAVAVAAIVYFVLQNKKNAASLAAVGKKEAQLQNNLESLVDHQEKVRNIREEHAETVEAIKGADDEKAKSILSSVLAANNKLVSNGKGKRS